MRGWVYKIVNWEYWPAYIIYAPTFILWTFYAIRFKCLKFFSNANPAIKNGGLYGDSKFSIYQLLPPDTYPSTFFIKFESLINFEETLRLSRLSFPFIAKPDIGYRGIMVKIIANMNEWKTYHTEINQNYLLQEISYFPNELGVFYSRLPSRSTGEITGITIKEFLSVTGNGVDSIRSLVLKNPRYALQISKLELQYNLNEILPNNKTLCLVPFGNHNRGTKFLNGNHLITPKLEKMINHVLANINDFYYGRLDIRYNSIEELESGKAFSIIELNGVKSEPTHIYDPKTSFWAGQKEIYRHQQLLYQIVKMNAGKK